MPKMIVATKIPPMITHESGAMRMPNTARSVLASRVATDETTSQRLGGSANTWRRSRMAYIVAWLPKATVTKASVCNT